MSPKCQAKDCNSRAVWACRVGTREQNRVWHLCLPHAKESVPISVRGDVLYPADADARLRAELDIPEPGEVPAEEYRAALMKKLGDLRDEVLRARAVAKYGPEKAASVIHLEQINQFGDAGYEG